MSVLGKNTSWLELWLAGHWRGNAGFDPCRNVVRIFGNSRKPRRSPGVHPRQAEEVESRQRGDSAVRFRKSTHVENRQMDIPEVRQIAGAPDDTGDVVVQEIQIGRAYFG